MDWGDSEVSTFPNRLTTDAWTESGPASGRVAKGARQWAISSAPEVPKKYMLPMDGEPEDWPHEDIGWGLILPYRADVSKADRIAAKDAPEPIRELLKERSNAPVLRYYPNTDHSFTYLGNEKSGKPVLLSGAERGIGDDALPKYLLICGSPAEVPWQLQYQLNTNSSVGRLDLEGEALENYVGALLSGWKGAKSDPYSPLIWAVDHRTNDISTLMRVAVAEKIYNAFLNDPQGSFAGKVQYVNGSTTQATHEVLIKHLTDQRPGLVVTTSHGKTGPLNDPAKMKEQLGLLIDYEKQPLDIAKLLAAWQPDGAIWYAHACCSAGGSSQTQFDGLVEKGGQIDQVLKGIAALGSMTSPLPRALLGAKKPLRAFVGHVEPTFNWTLKQKVTKQYVTGNIRRALYNGLYKPKPRTPVGLALRAYYEPSVAELLNQYWLYREQYGNTGDPKKLKAVLYGLIMAFDVRSMVLLGDPTSMLAL